jgi:hypothetical protein
MFGLLNGEGMASAAALVAVMTESWTGWDYGDICGCGVGLTIVLSLSHSFCGRTIRQTAERDLIRVRILTCCFALREVFRPISFEDSGAMLYAS